MISAMLPRAERSRESAGFTLTAAISGTWPENGGLSNGGIATSPLDWRAPDEAGLAGLAAAVAAPALRRYLSSSPGSGVAVWSASWT